ncbi:hypothetical protein COLO4_03805 [Corchorus olitorius]|uniref:Kinesin motor domain-containing protein n=1 Tax=Corchorus olitorius TaxID=93759 RepID=A0A1R3KWJ0_9ROSI|nr:hypothetical protein COLO4_03805 [Corchorus olitorius]
MEAESILQVSVMTVLEDVLQQQGNRTSNITPALLRYEAAGWLRKTVGVVGGKDLPAEPSEEEFRLGLRSGIILCNVLNKVQPGAVPKVVEGACDSVIIPDGAALSAYQYFENIRNFLVAVEEMGIPTFEASDFEQGGKSSRIVHCVLALKSYSEWKQNGAIGTWKYSANAKPSNFGTAKPFARKNSEPFMNPSISRTVSLGEKSVESFCSEQSELSEAGSVRSLQKLVRAALSDKRQEEIPVIVESMLNKLTEEFERRLTSQKEQIKITSKDMEESVPDDSASQTASCEDKKDEVEAPTEAPTNEVVEAPTEEMVEDEALSNETSESPTEEVIDNEPSKELQKSESYKEKCKADEEESLRRRKAEEEESLRRRKAEEESLRRRKADEEESIRRRKADEEKSMRRLLKQQALVEQQKQDIMELKHSLHATKSGMQCLQKVYREEFIILGKQFHRLSHAALGYQKVLEENRKLYNQVQDLKGNIRVYCRVRPFLNGQQNNMTSVDHVDHGSITIVTPSKYGKEGKKSFTFNRAFGSTATQAEVFADTQPLIRSVLDGYNVCIFAYGQTGSGKTYTMTGPKELTEEELGVNYRALGDLFFLQQQRKETISYEISVQMLEIYNEQVRDLLSSEGLNKRYPLHVYLYQNCLYLHSSQNGINVPDANLVRVTSTADVINLMNLGHKNRAVSATAMNDRSSRSHSCLTVHVQGKELTSGNILRGSMHLVDLAGSERVDKSEVTGDRLKEAQHINKSLAALGDVISSLASKNAHVPYRNSKLTQLLQDSLGGQAKTLMFVHIAPEYEALVETISTLKFAERVATIELGAAKVNKDSGGEVRELKEQIASLKAALARKEGEPESMQMQMQRSQSLSSSSETNSMSKTGSSPSPSLPKWNSLSDLSSSNINTENESSSTSRRDSLEIQEMLANPSLWPPLGSPALSVKEDDKDSVPGDWVDKVMVNKPEKLDNTSKNQNPSPASKEVSKEVINGQLPGKFYQTYIRAPTKVHPESNLTKPTAIKKGNQDDDSDATSDCSEPEVWQSNTPKATNGAKPKKQQLRTVKSTETRSSIPSLIPSPSARKSPNAGANQTLQKGKRKTGVTK